LILGVAAFAGHMFLVVLPRKKAKAAYLEDEEDEDEDEYMDAPTGVAVKDADDERPWDDDVQDRDVLQDEEE